MTVVVAFYCPDGVVIAADSMITPRVGNVNVGHHHGRKVDVISGPQIHAFSGDPGQANRFKMIADLSSATAATFAHPLQYPLNLTAQFVQQVIATGIQNSVDVNTFLTFVHSGTHQCCVFEGLMQPRLLDEHHYYAALGSGKLSADPFLRFLTDIFCKAERPSVRDATLLATWVVQHVINTNPGGVAGPICLMTFERDAVGNYTAEELTQDEIQEHLQAVEGMCGAMEKWLRSMQSGAAGAEVPQPAQPDQPVPANAA